MSIPQNYFYHSSIRNVTAAFGSLFTNINIERVDTNSVVAKAIRVPLSYASGDKTLRMLQQQDTIRREGELDIKISLPRMSFELTSVNYDSIRKTQNLNSLLYDSVGASSISRQRQYSAVPYNFEYSLNIYTKYIDDSLQIIEQILPYFIPFYTVTTTDIPILGVTRDIPIAITSITKDDSYEGVVEEDRILQWTLTFIANGWIYPPVLNTKIIKKSYANIMDFDTEQKMYGTLFEVTPFEADVDDDYTITKTTT